MDMSAAALPPRSGTYLPTDMQHPLFPLYREHRSSCQRLMIDSSDFRDWLFQYERNLQSDNAAKHPRFAEFQAWCRETQSGRRRCPAGCFPHNFNFWLEGGALVMINDLCGKCDGRGFHWQAGEIVSRETGTTLARTYRQGETCAKCRGTGRRDLSGRIALAFAGLAVAVFFIIYALGSL